MRQPLNTREAIDFLIRDFYSKALKDALLKPIFESAIEDLEAHLPIIADFWDSLLLGSNRYKGNPFAKHIPLPIDAKHFERWLALFHQSVDEHFVGDKAEEAKQRSTSIAYIFQKKLSQIHKDSL